jgi:signal transduction histidine kinase
MKCRFNIKFEYRLSLLYLILGALWILFSDRVLNLLITDLDARASIQLVKGWFYVLLTAVFFFFFIKRHLKKLRESEASLSAKNRELGLIQQELEKKNSELNRAKDKAEESNKLKTAFLNNISHEFRTPMNSILGFTGMLTRSDISDKRRAEFANYIDLSTHKLLDMVTDVIEISQIQLGEIRVHETACDIDNLLNKIEQQAIQKTAGRPITFKINRHIESKTILIDSYKMGRILKHLIDNAIKFTNKGTVTLDVIETEDHLDMVLTDTGIGIPENIKDIIFDAFRQEELGLTRNYGGSGLGLALVKAFTNLMEGSLHIESTQDIGTRISLTLPYRLPKSKSAPISHKNKPDLSDRTILIADDEIFNYYYLKEVLDELNMKSMYAPNGLKALEMFLESDKVDLILMDIKMPVMDGFEATRQIRKHHHAVPIIAQSAYVLERDELTKHFTDILPKPILRDDLRKVINKYIN